MLMSLVRSLILYCTRIWELILRQIRIDTSCRPRLFASLVLNLFYLLYFSAKVYVFPFNRL
jgi:hypothetical protein